MNDDKSLDFPFLVGEKVNGSAASLSGLVQLPPKERQPAELLSESSDESDKIEQADMGRLMDSPKVFCSEMFHSLSNTVRCADGVRGAVDEWSITNGAR